jgi:hypothetical protein
MRKLISLALALSMILALAAPTLAAPATSDIYLKGESKGNFNEVWSNIIYLGDMDNGYEEYQVWHIVYTGELCVKKSNPPVLTGEVTAMQLDFTIGDGTKYVWNWVDAGRPVSINGGGNNYGWVIVAPLGWKLTSGNSVHKSFLTTTNTKNVNFNISNYNSFENPSIEIAKSWVNLEGKEVQTGNTGPNGEKALFDVYTSAAFYSDPKGYPTWTGWDGSKAKIAPGTYVVVEQEVNGYLPQDSKTITVKTNGGTTKISFVNVPKTIEGSLRFEKKVEGQNIVRWLEINYPDKVSEILQGLEFYLKGDNGSYGPKNPDPESGIVAFANIKPGTYTLTEKVTGAAKGIFKEMADIEVIIGEGDNQFFVLGGTIKGVIEGTDIREDDRFTIVNGYGSLNGGRLMYGSNSELLNNDGDLFYIGVTNLRTGFEFASFCANAGSKNFDEQQGGYMVAHSIANELKWLQAFNYIVDNYTEAFGELTYKGVPNSTRKITQTVVWALLGAVDVNSELFDATTLSADEKAAVRATMANYEGYVGNGLVVDVVYMTCKDHGVNGHTFTTCQPQIVPVFGTFFVENELKNGGEGFVRFNKVKYGGLLPVNGDEFSFELHRLVEGKEDEYVGTYFTKNDGNNKGIVEADGLAPGNYVFKEIPAVDHSTIPNLENDPNGGHGFRYVWKAIYPGLGGGLFFTIPPNGGEAIWPKEYGLDKAIIPTVDNVYYCKHSLQWTFAPNQEEFDWVMTQDNAAAFPVEGHPYGQWGYLWSGICGDAAFDIAYTEPTCTTNKVINLWHSCDSSATGFNVSVPGTALGHDLIIRNPEGFKFFYGYFENICTRAHTHSGWFDLGYGFDEAAWLDFFEAEFGPYSLRDWEETGVAVEFNGKMFNQMVDPSSPDYNPLYVYVAAQ